MPSSVSEVFKYTPDYEYKQTNWFEIRISSPDATNISANISFDNSLNAPNSPKDSIMFYVTQCDLPEINFDPVEAYAGNMTYRAAGRPSFNDNQLVFTDSLDDQVSQYFKDWQDKIYDPERGIIGRKRDYARRIEIRELLPDGTVESGWVLFSCWPSSVSYGSLSYDTSDRRELAVSITYDWARKISNLGKSKLN